MLCGLSSRITCGVVGLCVALSVVACSKRSAAGAPPTEASRTFQTVCARCHGADGGGGIAMGAATPARNLRDAAFQAERTDEQLYEAIKLGKGAMPAFGALFQEDELRGLVAEVRRIGQGAKR